MKRFESLLLQLLLISLWQKNSPSQSFQVSSQLDLRPRRRATVVAPIRSSAPSDVETAEDDDDESLENKEWNQNVGIDVVKSKIKLIQLAASYDRGFGASPSARNQVAALIESLERQNESRQAASTILQPEIMQRPTSTTLIGNWRMIWTTAFDVLSLQASPFFIAGAIYQVFESAETKIVTNIIDFIPRIQSLSPSLLPNTLIRAKVQTRACLPSSGGPNRVGLNFEAVAVQPIQLIGFDSTTLPPLAFDLPKLPGTSSSTSSPGYFDVTYLDDDLLIIRQNQPGGLFCLLRTDSIDP
jgi:PAP_fibrillin